MSTVLVVLSLIAGGIVIFLKYTEAARKIAKDFTCGDVDVSLTEFYQTKSTEIILRKKDFEGNPSDSIRVSISHLHSNWRILTHMELQRVAFRFSLFPEFGQKLTNPLAYLRVAMYWKESELLHERVVARRRGDGKITFVPDPRYAYLRV